MAQRHWLDPLARRLLQATGQLPPDPPAPGFRQHNTTPNPRLPIDDTVEQELLALKLRHTPAHALSSAAEVQQLAAQGWRLDVNRATRTDWLKLPGIQPDQVDLLLRLQAGGVQLSGPEDLQHLLNLGHEHLRAWLPVLEFRWYGDPPATATVQPRLDLNRASRQQLSGLGLSAERCQRLLRERARQPFHDLADLQQRLQLPPALVESWIGKVCFTSGPIGPVLPPPLRRSPLGRSA